MLARELVLTLWTRRSDDRCQELYKRSGQVHSIFMTCMNFSFCS